MMTISAALAAFLLVAVPAHAAITDWQDVGGGRARMVAMLEPETNLVRAAIEIELEDGWKTYWREPGRSGIPPQFDFAGSKHFIPGEVGLPAPAWLFSGGEQFAGYKDQTSFYFEGQPLPGEGGTIRVDMVAGVCQEICIPAQASFEIPLDSLRVTDPRARVRVTLAHSRLPDLPREGFRIVSARSDDAGGLVVETEIPEDTEPELFVETPGGVKHLPPELVENNGGRAVFRVSKLASAVPSPEGQYRFTLSAGGTAIDQWLAPER